MSASREEAIRAILMEIEATARGLAARLGDGGEGTDAAESADDVPSVEEQLRYLDELTSDLAATRESLSEEELRAAGQAELLESEGRGLAIVVGHTQKAPGAQGKAPPFPTQPGEARYEYAWNTDLAGAIQRKATGKGIRCLMFFRDEGGITGAYARVKQWGPQATVELHFNAANEQARGTETLFATAGSKDWAQALQDAMVAVYGRQGGLNRGLRDRSDGGRGHLSLVQITPSALIEPFFGDEKRDAELGNRLKQALADAVVAAFEQWAGATRVS